jgi:hypothetical protein
MYGDDGPWISGHPFPLVTSTSADLGFEVHPPQQGLEAREGRVVCEFYQLFSAPSTAIFV